MRDLELTFTNAHVPQARGLRVFFVPSRTSIEGFTVRGIPQENLVKDHRDLAIEVQWRPALSPGVAIGESIIISLLVEGEPLVPAQTLWYDAEGGLYPDSAHAASPAGLVLAAGGPLDDFRTYASALFMARCEMVHAHPNHRVSRYGKFFCDLDLHTNPSLLGHARLPPADISRRIGIAKVIETLLLKRMDERRRGTSLSLASAQEEEHIREMSQILLGLYRDGLNTGEGRIDPEELWTAFEMFANGELRVPMTRRFRWNSEPNGAALFCFAEFGFLAHELGYDVREWEMVLPNHVAIQKIFAEAYRPTGKLLFDNYVPGNWHETKKVGPRFKAQLRLDFWDLSVEDLEIAARDNLKQALADEPK